MAQIGASVTIHRAGRAFSLGLEQVREAIDLEHLTPVPTAPPAIAGVVNLRGEVVPVLNLGALVGGSTNRPRPGDVLVVVEEGGMRVAIAVDRVAFMPAGTDPTRAAGGLAIEPLDAQQLIAMATQAVADSRTDRPL
jgi:hypothetical protein